jgi:hypothetical protein
MNQQENMARTPRPKQRRVFIIIVIEKRKEVLLC